MTTVACVMRSGGEYGPADVAVLYNALRHHIQGQFQLLVLTDKPQHIGAGVVGVILRKAWPGWWSKMELFRPDLRPFYPFLYLDLDTAIMGDVSLMAGRNSRWLGMLKDFHFDRPASGVMQFPEGFDPRPLWKTFATDPGRYMKEHKNGGDQEFIGKMLGDHVRHLQDLHPLEIVSFKPTRKRWLWQVDPPTSLVCFHGHPRPREALDRVDWVRQYFTDYQPTEEQRANGLKADVRILGDGQFIEAPRWEGKETGTLLVLGSAEGGVEEFEQCQAKRPNAKVMTIGHAAGAVRAHYLVSDHYEVHSDLRRLQTKYHTSFTTHCTYNTSWERWPAVDCWWHWRRSEASSVQTAIRVGLVMGFDEIILCGSPLEHGKIQHEEQVAKDGVAWPPPRDKKKHGVKPGWNSSDQILKQFRHHFAKWLPTWKGRVFSMSGFTREVLGEPTL